MKYLIEKLVQDALDALPEELRPAGSATGIVVAIAFVRSFARHSAAGIGNAWADLFRATTWILLPLSLIFALFLASQGVIQNFSPYKVVTTLEVNAYQQPKNGPDGQPLRLDTSDFRTYQAPNRPR